MESQARNQAVSFTERERKRDRAGGGIVPAAVVLAVVAFAVTLIAMACGGGNSTPTSPSAVLPQGGTWSGAVVSFNVSADGSRITTVGSSLNAGTGPLAVRLVCTGLYFGYDDTPITNARFSSSYNSGPSSFTVTGTFTSATAANGTYSACVPLSERESE